MKKIIYLLVFILTASSCVSSGELYYDTLKKGEKIDTTGARLDHSAYEKLLQAYVNDQGFVDYEGLNTQKTALKSYLDYLDTNSPKQGWETGEQFAYYINLYNAATLYLIIDNGIPQSIKDISGPLGQVWLKKFIQVNGDAYSLADVEKSVLQQMGDPRIHFAINCASYSCPKLLNTAFTGSNINQMMQKAAYQFVNSNKNDLSDSSNPQLSSIFKFYPEDFKNVAPSIIDYVNIYAVDKINSDAQINYKEYDWSLNNQ